MRRFVILGFGLLLSAYEPTVSSAQETPRVLLISVSECCGTEYWSEAETKIRNEFLQAGYRTIRMSGEESETTKRRDELERLTIDNRAVGAVRILRRGDPNALIEMWILESDSQTAVHRRVTLSDAQSRESADVAAWKTLEAFQGGLQDLRVAAMIREVPPVTVDAVPDDPGRGRTVFAGVGFGGVAFVSDGPVLGAPLLLLGWMPQTRFQLQLEGGIRVVGNDVVDGSDRARLRGGFVSLKPVFSLLPKRRVQPLAGGFVGMNGITLAGESRSGAPEHHSRMVAALFGATVQVSVVPEDRFRLTLFVDAGTQVPRTRVVFGDRWVTTFGAAMLRFGIWLAVLR